MGRKPLKEQVVVVMGASSGIGRAAAIELAKRGAKVVCAARSEQGLVTLMQDIGRRGGAASAIVADASDAEQVRNVAKHAVMEFGRIDTWIHLAAVTIYARAEETRPAEFARVIQVNLLGQIHGALAALPHLRRAGGGALIHVSSVESQVALPYQSAYAASKHGMTGFLDALRLELMHEGAPVTVTNIQPSSINTPLFQKALTRLGVEPRGTPPVYQPEAVVAAILHAAEHPVRDLVVGGAGRTLIAVRRISGYLTDAILLGRIGFASQKTDRPKSPDAPGNLWKATEERYLHVHGDLGDEALSESWSTRIATSIVGNAARGVARIASRAAAGVVESGWLLTLPRMARAKIMRMEKARRAGRS